MLCHVSWWRRFDAATHSGGRRDESISDWNAFDSLQARTAHIIIRLYSPISTHAVDVQMEYHFRVGELVLACQLARGLGVHHVIFAW